jgi:RHS repeat-associated protein
MPYRFQLDQVFTSISSFTKDYPFGSLIQNRSWSDASREYRYGFNGKEKDFETSSDNYDFGARIYDGRLGRWLSLDPLMKKYPNASNYLFSHNSPISLIDPSGKVVIVGTLSNFNSGGMDVLVNSPVVSAYINQFASKQNGDQRFYQHTLSQANGAFSGQVNLSFTSVARNSVAGTNMIAANQDAQTMFTYNLSDGTTVAATAYVPVAGVNVVSINANIQVLSDDIATGQQSIGNQEAMGAATSAVAIVNELYTQIDGLTNTLNANIVGGSVNLDNVAQQFTALLNGPAPLPVSPALPGAINDIQQRNSSPSTGFYVQYDQVDISDQSNTARCRYTSSISQIINSMPLSPISTQSYIYPVANGFNVGPAPAGGDAVKYVPTPDEDRDVNAIPCQ